MSCFSGSFHSSDCTINLDFPIVTKNNSEVRIRSYIEMDKSIIKIDESYNWWFSMIRLWCAQPFPKRFECKSEHTSCVFSSCALWIWAWRLNPAAISKTLKWGCQNSSTRISHSGSLNFNNVVHQKRIVKVLSFWNFRCCSYSVVLTGIQRPRGSLARHSFKSARLISNICRSLVTWVSLKWKGHS